MRLTHDCEPQSQRLRHCIFSNPDALCWGRPSHPDRVTGFGLLTLHADATTVLELSDARQNISKPWPYLPETEDGRTGEQIKCRSHRLEPPQLADR